jgi:CRISPR-associated endonuclease Csn1
MRECRRVLGIDVGIASCGWGVIEVRDRAGSIFAKDGKPAVGVRCFAAPLVYKTGEPKAAQRRSARGQRRVIRRRRQRMNAIRDLLQRNSILPDSKDDALALALRRTSRLGQKPQVTPWALRAVAHDRVLTDDEFAVVLGHIARHRGFRSNSKREATSNAAGEPSKMKKAMKEAREGLAKYRSFGEMLASDPKFSDRKRNRDNDYSHTAKRSDLEDEVRKIFQAQRCFGNARATEELERHFRDKAFLQRPLQDSEDKVGNCPFEPDHKRTTKRAPSFELFRFLQRLVNLRIAVARAERSLRPEEIGLVLKKFGEQKSYTYKALRKDLDLDPNAGFSAIARNGEWLDIAARKGRSAFGTCILREVLGAGPWHSLLKTPEKLDRIAEILTFREDLTSIGKGLAEIGVDGPVINRLMQAASEGAFTEFKGAAHISSLAARNIIIGMRGGLVYSEACARAGYDHSERRTVSLDQIGSPVTALSEAIKQVRTVAREYGPFDAVHIELARDVGKSAEEREEITRGIEERNAEKDRLKTGAADLLKRAISDDELLRYQLAKEQNFKCVYCDSQLAPTGFAANNTGWQTDHILPWSRFGDDSYLNKTLCCTRCNQHKKGRTPFEWFSEMTETAWDTFLARLENLKGMKGLKKRNFKLRDAAAVEDKFKKRNLTDTRWVTRLLVNELKRMFPAPDGKRQIYTRPGAITSKLRRAWGLEGAKKENGERVDDDRHHAVDALVLAATTESLLLRVTKEIQQREDQGRSDDIFHVQQPWQDFRRDVAQVVYGENGIGGVFVSRAERRRARGKAHDATVKQIRQVNGEKIVFERRPIEKLTEKDLKRIPIPEPYGKMANPRELRDQMVEALRVWIAAGKPKAADKLPRSPKGDIIRKVRVASKDKVAIELHGGTVNRGNMARVDVFRKAGKKGKWDGDVIEGYFRSLDRNTGTITISPHMNAAEIRKGIGVKTLSSFNKFSVDRLGRKFKVHRELRTWRGKACT